MGLIAALQQTPTAATPDKPTNPTNPTDKPTAPAKPGAALAGAADKRPAAAAAAGQAGPAGRSALPALPDVRLGGFLRAVKANLHRFLPFASSTAAPADRSLLLRVLKALLTLDTNILLQPNGAIGKQVVAPWHIVCLLLRMHVKMY